MRKKTLLLLLAAGMLFLPAQTARAESLSELQDDLEEKEAEIKQIESQIEDTEDKIAELENRTEELTKENEALEEEKGKQQEDLAVYIQLSYENGTDSILTSLLESGSFGDLINKAEYFSQVYSYEDDLIAEYENLICDISDNIKSLNETQKDLTEEINDLKEKEQNLEDEITEIEEKVSEIQNMMAASYTSSEDTSGSYGDYSDSDLTLLAAIIEAEAGTSSYDGQLAVGSVIMNRVKSSRFPNTISGVVYQSGQFSPVTDGSLSKVLSRGPASSSYKAAEAVLSGARTISYLFFCADWYKGNISAANGTSIGGNYFYSY